MLNKKKKKRKKQMINELENEEKNIMEVIL